MKFIVLKLLALFMVLSFTNLNANATASTETLSTHQEETYKTKPFSEMVGGFLSSTGVNAFINPDPNEMNAHGEEMSNFHKSWLLLLWLVKTISDLECCKCVLIS